LPSVASEAPALKPLASPAPRPAAAPAPDGAAPFASLLGDTALAAAPEPAQPPPPANKGPARATKPDQPPKSAPAKTPAKTPAKPDDSGKADPSAAAESGAAIEASAKSDAKAGDKTKTAGSNVNAKTQATAAGVAAASGPAADSAKATDGKTDGKAQTDAKTDAQAAAQAAAEDGLKTPVKGSKDKQADSSKTADDDGAKTTDAAQALAANGVNAVATVVAPVTTPATLAPAKPAAKDAGIDVEGAAKGKQAAPALPQADTGIAGEDTKPADKTAAKSDGKPQAAGDDDKQAKLAPAVAAPAGSHHADTQPALNTGAHAAAKTADASSPPMTAPPQGAAPSAPAPAPAPQPLPQAAAIPLSGVAIDIAGKALAGKNRFEIRLDPPELGRVEVRLDVDRDGRITSHVIADRKDTLDLLQRDAAGLQRAFQDAGLKTADNGLQFSLRDQTAGQQQNPGGSQSNSAQLVVEDDSLAPIDATQSGYGRFVRLNGGLDIRV
jgi:flagellar hook-length control protein FliK